MYSYIRGYALITSTTTRARSMRLHGRMARCRARLRSCSRAQRRTLITSTTNTRSIDEVARANGAMASSPLLTQLCPRVRPYNEHNSYSHLPSCGYIQWRALITSTAATHLINEVPGANGGNAELASAQAHAAASKGTPI